MPKNVFLALLIVCALALAGCARPAPGGAANDAGYKVFAMCSAVIPIDMKRADIKGFNKFYKHPDFLDAYPDKEKLVNGITSLALNYGMNTFGVSQDTAASQYERVVNQTAAALPEDIQHMLALDLPLVQRVKLATGYVEYTLKDCRPVYEKAWSVAE